MPQAFIEVSHPPSAASLYAEITQPFGIRLLFASNDGSELCFGFPAFPPSPEEVILTIVGVSKPVPTTITFTAQSRDTVNEFHYRAQKALEPVAAPSLSHTSSASIAQVYDPDGNLIEARYSARRASEPVHHQSKGGGRIEAWREDVEKNSATTTRKKPPRPITRSVTEPISRTVTEGNRRLIPGISNQGLIGTVLGVAAGAAIAYAMVKSDESGRKGTQDATMKMSSKSYGRSRSHVYHDGRDDHYGPDRARARMPEIQQGIEDLMNDARGNAKSVQHDGILMIDNDRSGRGQARTLISSHSNSPASKSKTRTEQRLAILPAASSAQSHVSTRSRDAATVVRARDIPLPSSVVSSRVSRRARSMTSPRDVPPPESTAASKVGSTKRPERDNHSRPPSSYYSARSAQPRTRSRSSAPDPVATQATSKRSHSTTHRASTTVQAHAPSSHRPTRSTISAHNVPLPASVYGDDDDDYVSITPSDSVSCAGYKREKAERALMAGRQSLMERGSRREERAMRGVGSETDRLRRRF